MSESERVVKKLKRMELKENEIVVVMLSSKASHDERRIIMEQVVRSLRVVGFQNMVLGLREDVEIKNWTYAELDSYIYRLKMIKKDMVKKKEESGENNT